MSFHKATSSHSQMEKMKAYRRLRQCCSFSDVFIYTQDHQSISAHRPVLAAHSPWLARLFDYFDCGCGNATCGQNGRGEVRLMIPGVDMDHLERLMDLLYLGWVQLGSSEEYTHLQTLAHLLGIRRFPPMPRQAFRQTQVEVIDLLEEEDLDEMEEDEEDEELELEPESSDSPTWDPELAEFSYLIEDSPDHELTDDSDDFPTDDNMNEWAKPSSDVSFASEPILDQQDPLSNPEGVHVDQFGTDEPEPDLPESAAVCVHCYQVFSEPTDLVAHLSQDHPQSVPEIENMVQNFSFNDINAPSNLGARASDSSQTDGQPQSLPSQKGPLTKKASESRLGDFLQPPKVNSSPLASFARIRILPRKQPVLKATPEKDTNPGQAHECELQTDLAPNLPSQLEIFRLPQSLPSDQTLDTSAEELKRIMAFSPKFPPKADGDVFKRQIVQASHQCVSSSQNILHQPETMESSSMMPSDPPTEATEATSLLGTHTTSNAEPNPRVDRDTINEPENVQQMKLGLSENPNLQQLKSVMPASPKIMELPEQDEIHEVAECVTLAKEPTSLELNEPVQNQTCEITQQVEPHATSKPASQHEDVGQWVEFRQDQETAQLVLQESEILQSQQTCQFNQHLKLEMSSDMVDAGVNETVETETVQISPRRSDDSPSQLKPIEYVSAPPNVQSTRRDEPEPDPEKGFGLHPQPDVDDELPKREEALQGFVLAQNPLQNLESRKSDDTKLVESEVSVPTEMDGNLSRKSQVQVQFVDKAQHQISDYLEHLTNVQRFQSTKEYEVPEKSSVPQIQLDREVDLTQHVTPQPTRSPTFTSSSQERNPTLETGTQPCKSNVRPALLDTFVESPEQILETTPNLATLSRPRSERDEAHETRASGTAQYVVSTQHVLEQSESSGTIACEQSNPIPQSKTERWPSPKSRAAPNEEQVEQPELITTESGTLNSKPKKPRANRPTKTCPKPLKPKPAPRPRPKPGKRGKSKVKQPEDVSPHLGENLPIAKKQGPKKHPAKRGKNKRATKCVTSEDPAPNSLSEGDFEAIAQETRNLAQMAETNETSMVDALEHEMEGNLEPCPGTVDISDSVSQEACQPITTKNKSSANLEMATTLPNRNLNKSKGPTSTSPSATPSLPWVLRPKRKRQTSPLLEPKPKRTRGPQKQKELD